MSYYVKVEVEVEVEVEAVCNLEGRAAGMSREVRSAPPPAVKHQGELRGMVM